MNIDGSFPKLDAVGEILSSKKIWDYVIMDAWHFGRGPDWGQGRATVPPEFPKPWLFS